MGNEDKAKQQPTRTHPQAVVSLTLHPWRRSQELLMNLARQPLPPWKPSSTLTRKPSLPVFCILGSPSHSLSREAWRCSSPTSPVLVASTHSAGHKAFPLLSTALEGGQWPPGEAQVGGQRRRAVSEPQDLPLRGPPAVSQRSSSSPVPLHKYPARSCQPSVQNPISVWVRPRSTQALHSRCLSLP